MAAEPAELEADIIIMVDPDVDVAWGALQVSINAAVEQGANVAVLLHAAQNEELPDPPCLSCGGASCGNDVPVLKVVYELESVFTALSFNDISCIFDDAPGLPRTRHYWLFTDDLTQSVSAEFAGAVSDSNARFHVSSPGGMSPAQGSQLAELVEATFGGEGETDSAAALADQMRFVGSRRLACAWTVDPVPDTLPFFFLSNEYISSKTSDEGVIGTPIGGPLNCDNRADPKAGVAEAPFEFYYQEVDSTPVAVACPIACAFIQLEPADDTVLADVYCIEPE